ncbi:receptor-type tyrosine-protein phosphatase S-like isoform X3 [Dysidea avara]|uniref:receptor-type tyrosine-protein phosphatase S-like isoform X3 n=1 Tax=Dysidea avara TaxID=196820 RepID=UPI0033168D29
MFSFINFYNIANITTQPSDVIVCTGRVAVFTCVVDRNGTNITSDDMMWQQIRVPGGMPKKLSTSVTGGVPFNITTTISGDILTSTLTITGATDSNPLGTSSYRCVVNDIMSRNASLHVSSGPPGMPMNIRFSDITNTSFIVQWDEVDDADQYIVNWRDYGGSVRESTPSLTPHTITGLTPNTTYVVYVGVINACGSEKNSSIKNVTTKMSEYLLLPSSVSTSLSVLTTPLTMFSTMEIHNQPTSSVSMKDDSASDSNGGGAGAVIGGVVGGLIVVTVVVIIVTVICWCAYNTKSDDDDQQKKAYATLRSQQDTLTKNYEERNPEYDYAAINKLVSVSVPHQATTDGVQYAVSTKTASKEGQDELPPLEDSYATVDKEKQITLSVPHQMSAGAVQYAVSTKVATKSVQGEDDDVKDPEGLNYADLQHDVTPGNKPRDDHQNTVKYTQVI